MVDETGEDKPKVDEMAVDEIAVDEPGPHHPYLVGRTGVSKLCLSPLYTLVEFEFEVT